jgi:outer membrane protein
MTDRTRRTCARFLWLVLLAPVTALGAVAAHAADASKAAPAAVPKIGWVDAQAILDETATGKDVRARVEAFRDSRQKVMDLEEDEIKKLQEKIDKQGSLLSDDVRRQKVLEINEKAVAFQKKFAQYQKELHDKTDELLGEFNDALIKAVQVVAAREGYQYVFDHGGEGSVLYGAPEFDLTPTVKAEMDAKPE